ncbi:MAG: SPFH domain-containing protein [Lachnospiraceae bacterium]|jgi:membrane protease subunit (stomatin/prohibitin family)|nr:SPFH domain-containing protein [Lachnospiraceae bacterium]
MGLIQAIGSAISGSLADQWKEFFYCDAIGQDTLMVRGQKKLGNAHPGSNTRGDDNIISNGSTIAVADGQCMLIVEQGKVVELCAQPGEFTWDSSTEPSIFCGNLGQGILDTFKQIGRRFTYGGTTGKDQRVYYINTKELMGNKYGTANPVPFRVVDQNAGMDLDIGVRCFGEYSYKIVDPILFYTNVCGNVTTDYTRDTIDSQLKTELLTALQPAFAKISAMGVRYSAVPAHTTEMADALNEELSDKWSKLRGIKIVSFGISSLTASEEDEQRIKDLQTAATLRNPAMAAGALTAAQAQAMRDAAKNSTAGPAMAFMGMNMAGNAGGMNAQQFYGQAQQNGQNMNPGTVYPTAANGGFGAAAGAVAGAAGAAAGQPAQQAAPAGDSWKCPSCGTVNNGRFCTNCGTAKPAAPAVAKCPKCGYEYDPANPPKFCPNCGNKLQ